MNISKQKLNIKFDKVLNKNYVAYNFLFSPLI